MIGKILSAKSSQSAVKGKTAEKAKARPPLNARLTTFYTQDGLALMRVLFYSQFLLTTAAIVMIVLLANFSASQIRVMATTVDNKLISPPPLDVKLGEDIIVNWANDAVSRALTFGFHDADLRQKEIRTLFTDIGWQSYTRSLRASTPSRPSINTLLEEFRLLQWARPEKPPLIIEQSLIGGVYVYRIRVFMLLSFRTSSTFNSGGQSFAIDLEIQRVPPTVNSAGIGISLWQVVQEKT